MQKGVISDYIKSVCEEWRLHCGLTDTQLFIMYIHVISAENTIISYRGRVYYQVV